MELQDIYNRLLSVMRSYEGRLIKSADFGSRYELVGDTEYKVTSEKTGKTTKKKNAYFAGLIIQRNYVGLYLMAPYMKPEYFTEKEFPALRPMLKGKSCFHIKSVDSQLLLEVAKALKVSYDIYVDEGLA